jgi:hypothetical protein
MIEWRPIPGYEAYSISEYGEVKRVIFGQNGHEPKTLKATPDGDGYLDVTLARPGAKPKMMRVHRLVAMAFHGPAPSEKHIVAHNDGTRTNNHYSNLRWATQKENHGDRKKHGTHTHGSRSHLARLTEEAVIDIRERHEAGLSIRKLSRIHGVSPLTISDIVKGRSWTMGIASKTIHEINGGLAQMYIDSVLQ